MKTLFTIVFLLIGGSSIAQTAIIQNFTVRQLGDGFIFNWKINKGNSCIDMNVQMGEDSVNFNSLGIFHGLCGTDQSDTYYDWYEVGPFDSGKRYYFQIYASNGSVLSETRFLDYFSTDGQLLTIAPNPVVESSNVYFSNPTRVPYDLRIVDLRGATLYQQNQLTENAVEISDAKLAKGIYILSVEQEGKLLESRKFVVD